MPYIYAIILTTCFNTNNIASCSSELANLGMKDNVVNTFILNEECIEFKDEIIANKDIYHNISGKNIISAECVPVSIPKYILDNYSKQQR